MAIEIVESLGDATLNNGQLAVVGRLDNAVKLLEQKEQEFAAYLEELETRRKEVDKLKDSLKEMMTNEGVGKLESEHLLITLVRPKDRHTIDMKKIKAVNPALYTQLDMDYGTDTPVSSYVKLTPRTR